MYQPGANTFSDSHGAEWNAWGSKYPDGLRYIKIIIILTACIVFIDAFQVLFKTYRNAWQLNVQGQLCVSSKWNQDNTPHRIEWKLLDFDVYTQHLEQCLTNSYR